MKRGSMNREVFLLKRLETIARAARRLGNPRVKEKSINLLISRLDRNDLKQDDDRDAQLYVNTWFGEGLNLDGTEKETTY